MQSQGRNFPVMLKGILGSDVLWLQIFKLLFSMFNNVACSEKKKNQYLEGYMLYVCHMLLHNSQPN